MGANASIEDGVHCQMKMDAYAAGVDGLALYAALLAWRRAVHPPAKALLDGLHEDVRSVWESSAGSRIAASWLALLAHTHAALDRWQSVQRWMSIYEQYAAMHGRSSAAPPTHRWQFFALARAADRWEDFSAMRTRALVALGTAARLSRDEHARGTLARWMSAARALRHVAEFGALSGARLLFGRWVGGAAGRRARASPRAAVVRLPGARLLFGRWLTEAARRRARAWPRAAVALLAGKGKSAVLRAWRKRAGVRARARASALRAVRLLADSRLALALYAFRAWRDSRRSEASMQLACRRLLAVTRARRALSAARAHPLRPVRAAALRLRGSQLRRRLLAATSAWRALSAARARPLRLLRAAAVRLRGLQLGASLRAWAGCVRADAGLRAVTRFTDGGHRSARLADALASWRLSARREAAQAEALAPSGVRRALESARALTEKSMAVLACGANGLGQLGVGAPRLVETPAQPPAAAIGSGAADGYLAAGSAVLTPILVRAPPALADGAQAPRAADIVAVACGDAHTAWLSCAGSLFVAGAGTASAGASRRQLAELCRPVRARGELEGVAVLAVSCGEAHTLALGADGRVYAWGVGSSGQLGTGDRQPRDQPAALRALGGRRVQAVACGARHSLALADAGGAVLAWGGNELGQLGGRGADVLLPAEVALPPALSVASVAAGCSHSALLGSRGEVYTWGCNAWGQLGLGDRLPRERPTRVRGLPAVRALACGQHTAAVGEGGEFFTWGNGKRGQLGHGDTASCALPRRVQALARTRVAQVACGRYHTAVVTADGSAHAWGGGESGQLGLGDAQPRALPAALALARVGALSHGALALAVACGGEHTVLIVAAVAGRRAALEADLGG